MSQFTDEEKYQELLGEVSYRQIVYAKMLRLGTIDEAKAKWCIAIMKEIASDYAKKTQPSLFAGK